MDLKLKNWQLNLGVAYHGNRILRHVEEDMRDIVAHNMNTVVHMFTHNDWDRHLKVMKDVISVSEYYGLNVWVDNWGIAGAPGDKAHFLLTHHDAHQILSDGKPHAYMTCFNNEDFVKFSQDWAYTVREIGGKKLFWDEPAIVGNGKDGKPFGCFCPTCQKLFRERYGKEMDPTGMTPEMKEFRNWTIQNYFRRMTDYAVSLGLENSCCSMPHNFDEVEGVLALPNMHDVGIDPYWNPRPHPERNPYLSVYEKGEAAYERIKASGKKHHLWIQAYDNPAYQEDDIIMATDAAYDLGARDILYWSYRGGESNTYRADKCEKLWHAVGEATARIRNRHFDTLREESIAELKKMKQK